ncbi:hypothetical protein ACIBFB_20070 [Nocardiopsis sp. NPDC050513]|uniref:hypothetical protein n=1 Tax=Nocardiopsis sp. NPDC050513 TaxID=3364338 RepID=UPI0037A1BCD8
MKRVVPAVISRLHPRLKDHFRGVERLRIMGRTGELEAADIRTVYVHDGIFSSIYATILGILLLGVHYIAFDVVGLPGGDFFLRWVIFLALLPFLATAVVEAFEHLRSLAFERFASVDAGFKMLGPVSYLVLYLASCALIASFFLVTS